MPHRVVVLLSSYLVYGCDGVVVVLDCVLDLLEGVLGVVHAEGDSVQQIRLEEGHGGGVVEAQREATVVVADTGRLLRAAGGRK